MVEDASGSRNRRTLVTVGGLALVIVLIGWASLRGRSAAEFADAVAELERRGEPVRLAQAIDPGSIPEAENAAVVVRSAKAALPEDPEGVLWATGIDDESPLSLVFLIRDAFPGGGTCESPTEEAWTRLGQAIERTVAQNRAAVEGSREARTRPRCSFVQVSGLDPRKAIHWMYMRWWAYDRLSVAVTLDVLAKVHAGDRDAALVSLEAIFALARFHLNEPYAGHQSAGCEIERLGCALILHLVADGIWPGADPAAWVARLEGEARSIRWRDALVLARAEGLETFDAVLAGARPCLDFDMPWRARKFDRVRDELVSRDGLVYLSAMAEAISLADRPYWEVAGRVRAIDEEMDDQSRNAAALLDDVWGVDRRGDLDPTFRTIADTRTALALARAALEAFAERGERGAWLADLGALAPIDHRTGRAGRLEVRDGDAWIVLHEVGEWRVRAPR